MCISRVYTCISRAYTCIHVKYTCIHVIYTCYTPGNGLVMLAILKIPYFDPSYTSVTSEIFLSLILKNDPCLKNGILKLFLGHFCPRNKYNLYIYAIPEEHEQTFGHTLGINFKNFHRKVLRKEHICT